MTKSKWIGLLELGAAALLGGLLAWWRAGLARGGRPLTYGGIGYDSGWLGIALAAAAAALLVLAVLGERRRQQTAAGGAYKLAAVLAALGMLAAAGLLLAENTPAPTLFPLVQIAFLALCGVTLLLRTLRGEGGPGAGMLSLFPVYYMCLLLLAFYRENAKNPVVSSFALEILTLVALTVAVYGLSSRYFGRFQPRLHAFFSLVSILLASHEMTAAALYPNLLLSVPGVTPATLAIMGAMALYVAAGFFLGPRPAGAGGPSVLPAPDASAALPAPGADTLDFDVDILTAAPGASADLSAAPPESAAAPPESAPPESESAPPEA